MCGIAGFCRHPDDNFNANTLAKELLLGIEERGRDATGAAWRDRHGETIVQKYDINATKFTPLLALDKRAPVAVLHTRLATQGDPSNNLNNHPIRAEHIVGIHNGMVSNDWELFADAKNYHRQGRVDSEAIFATIARVDDKFTLTDALEAPEARMALAWLDDHDTRDEVLHIARGDGSPLVVGQTHAGTLIFASTEKAVLRGAKAVGLDLPYLEEVGEGEYFTVFQGRIVNVEKFAPRPQFYSYSYSNRKSSGVLIPSGSTTTTTTRATTGTFGGDYLDMKYLDVDTPITLMPYKDAAELNKTRDRNVSAWVEDHTHDVQTGEALSDHDIFEQAAQQGAFLRPGSWVTTYVKDEVCDAQVYRMPRTFPEGDYILRVLIPVTDVAGEVIGLEAVFLARSAFQLEGEDMHIEPAEVVTDDADNEPKELMLNASN